MSSMRSMYHHERPTTDVSFEASISLWYCVPFLLLGLIGLASLAAGAGIGALIAAAIAKHKYKHKDDDGYGDYDYYVGVFPDGGYHRRQDDKRKDKRGENYIIELTKRSFGDILKFPLLKTFFRGKRSIESHTKLKNFPKKLSPVKQIQPVKSQEERLLESIQPDDELRCGERLGCEVAGMAGVAVRRPLSNLEQQILRFVRAGDDQFDRLVPGEGARARSAAPARR